MKRELVILSCVSCVSLASTAYAADHYIDPESGSSGNAGTTPSQS